MSIVTVGDTVHSLCMATQRQDFRACGSVADSNLSIEARRNDAMSIGAKGNARDVAANFAELDEAGRFSLPDDDRVIRRRGQQFSVSAEHDASNGRAMISQSLYYGAIRSIPQPHRSILAARGDEFSVWTEDGCVNEVRVSAPGVQLLPALCVPESHDFIFAD